MTDQPQLIFIDREYDLAGPQGNAFAILGTMVSWMKQCDVAKVDIADFQKEAYSGDYKNLLEVCTAATGVKFINSENEETDWC